MVFIYALQLEKGKYYIGKTNYPEFRVENHFQKTTNGAVEWTKLYKPIRLVELRPNCDDYDEDKITMQYMHKYGINNVRGGSFVTIALEPTTIHVLQQMSKGTNNQCFVCGKEGHFAKTCTLKKKREEKREEKRENVKETTKVEEKREEKPEKEPCNCPTSYFSPHRKFKCLLRTSPK